MRPSLLSFNVTFFRRTPIVVSLYYVAFSCEKDARELVIVLCYFVNLLVISNLLPTCQCALLFVVVPGRVELPTSTLSV